MNSTKLGNVNVIDIDVQVINKSDASDENHMKTVQRLRNTSDNNNKEVN